MTRSASSGVRRSARVRCTVYTRKSSEEGIEQEFNSLQAQREACEAFIRSQHYEGWVCLPAAYNDGGFSGATMYRPALQWLLADITAGRVDIIVVYKTDRLTGSLADFAKIVEIFDARGAFLCFGDAGVQHDDADGRLTLNVLLSFAQFEREVIGERIRDKIATSKQKGDLGGRRAATRVRSTSISARQGWARFLMLPLRYCRTRPTPKPKPCVSR